MHPTQSRIIGALVGVHAGDSLGATVEFSSHSKILESYPNGVRDIVGGGPFNWPAGHATDDTDLTRAVLLAYHEALTTPKGHELDIPKLAGTNFIAWMRGDWPGRKKGLYPVDIGSATSRGLHKFKKTMDPEQGGAGEGQAGNGSLMRCIPTGLFEEDPDDLVKQSMVISSITHDDARCTISCAAYNTIVGALVDGEPPSEAISAGEYVAEKLKGEDVLAAIRLGRELSVASMAERGPPRELKGRCSGYVLESLTLAVSAILDTRSLEEVLIDVVRIGGDTDTNGAIAGGLLGARDGIEAVPQRWREKLQFAEEFERVAGEIIEAMA